MNNLVLSLLSLILGALLGGAVKALQDRYLIFKESQAVAAAIHAEIAALLDVIERRRYLSALDWMIQHLSDPSYVPKLEDVFEVKVTQNYFQVFDTHCNKIGLLGSAAGPVVSVYTMGKAIVEDLRFLPDRHRSQPFDRAQLLGLHEHLRSMFDEMIRLGRVALEQLDRHGRRTFVVRLVRRQGRPTEADPLGAVS